MIRTLALFSSGLLLTLLVACGGGTSGGDGNASTTDSLSKMELTDTIAKLENQLVNQTSLEIDVEKAQYVVGYYKEFADRFPEDEQSPAFLFKAARVLIGLGSYQQAISYFERIKTHFPGYDKRGDAQFFIGFVYDEHLNQMGKAKENYEMFLEKYPDHNMADDAKALIEKLGMSDEEWLQMVQERNANAGDSAQIP